MACCKAEEFKWCKDLETVCSDEKGDEYCVFHAPKGQKGVTVEEFNDLIFKRIWEAKTSGDVCYLSGTIFQGTIKFRQFNKEQPLPVINVRGATFNGEVDFLHATFSGEADFSRVTFNREADFFGATFREKTYLHSSTFSEKADFREVTFNGEVNFFDATFSEKIDFLKATFRGQVDFFVATFRGQVGFNRCLVEKTIVFERVNLTRASFIGTDIRKFQFVSCTWPHKRRRDVLYDEINAHGVAGFEMAEDLYRQLKQKYKEEYNESEASKWHYGEKEMFRKKRWWRRFNPLSISNLYWASSGYGERPVRAGIMLLLFVAVVTMLMNIFGLVPLDGKPVYNVDSIKGFSGMLDRTKFWLLIYNTIQHALFFKTPYFKPETLAGDYFLSVFTRLLIPLQAALFAFALRNKFRR